MQNEDLEPVVNLTQEQKAKASATKTPRKCSPLPRRRA